MMSGIIPPSLFFSKRRPSKIQLNLSSNYDLESDTTLSQRYEQDSFGVVLSPTQSRFSIGANYTETRLVGAPILLNDNVSTRNTFRNLELRTSYNFVAKDKSIWALALGYGSQSDELFKRGKDNTLFMSAVNVRPGDKNRWILGAFFNSNMNIGTFPLPIVAYLYRPSRTFMLITGLPFINLRWGSFVGRSLFFIASPGGARLELAQSLFGPFAMTAGAAWGAENFQHVNRTNEDDQFFIERQTVHIGLRGPVAKGVMVNLNYGLRMNASYFQAEGIFDSRDFEVNLKDSSYFFASIKARL
jgi:hypothetical protein